VPAVYGSEQLSSSPVVDEPCTSSTSCSTSHSEHLHVSSAAFVVMLAADLTEGFDPKDLLLKLENECVTEDWQLEFLDSQQWQILGAPMGFVAAIRRCIGERKDTLLVRNSSSTSPPSLVARESSSFQSMDQNTLSVSERSEARDTFIYSPPIRRPKPMGSNTPPPMPQRRQSAGEGTFSEVDPQTNPTLQAWQGKIGLTPPPKPIRIPSVTLSET